MIGVGTYSVWADVCDYMRGEYGRWELARLMFFDVLIVVMGSFIFWEV